MQTKYRARPFFTGFTVIELLVVMAALALLVALAAPRYTAHVDRAREVTLRHNLAGMRSAIEAFRADRGRDPTNLAELIEARYLREIPLDPMTERSDTWVLQPSRRGAQGVGDVRSGAPGRGSDGQLFAEW